MSLTIVLLVLKDLLLVFGNGKLTKWPTICCILLTLVDFKPKYYCSHDPVNPTSILPHHVCHLYIIKMTNILCGNIFVCDMYSTTEYFDAASPVKESMPQDTLKDLVWCMHFSDDWDDERGE